MPYPFVFKDDALKDLEKMDKNQGRMFYKKAEKLAETGPRRHLDHIDYYAERVDKDGRMPYIFEDGTLYILRCFTDHKEYDKWCRRQH